MKELSIEEKAKRYDEAIEIAKNVHRFSSDLSEFKRMEQIFPELKESEDERIRKEIINYIKHIEAQTIPEKQYDSWIAWLEKQCEQKPADKVEPKFNLYDWVVTDKGDTVQIGAVNNGYYTLFNGMDFYMSYVDKCWHKWTIEDAKDGNVLCYKDEISLYKHDIKNCTKQETTFGGFVYHCCYDGKRFITESLYSLTEQDKMDIHPATKEQRDTLMKAMADAGYTFDFEKKELKKIVVPIFNIGDIIIKKHNSDIHDFGSFTITDITGGKYLYNDRIICDITKQDDWEIYEPVKQTIVEWSEDDETYLGLVITAIRSYYTDDKGKENPWREELLSWLESLKDRVMPQPKLEWSEEDETVLNNLIYALANDRIGNNRDEYLKFSNDVDATDYSFPIDLADYKDFAKHFFELGIKAQKL